MDVWDGEGIRQALGVLTVLGLLALVAWKLRAGAGKLWPTLTRGDARLQSAGRLVLTPQHTVHLVRVDGRELVVATHPHGCSLLVDAERAHGASV